MIENGANVQNIPYLQKRETQLKLLNMGIARELLKNINGINGLFGKLDKSNAKIRKSLNGTLIRDLENIIYEYICV